MSMLNSVHSVDALKQSQAAYSLLMVEHQEALERITSLEEEVERLKEQIRLMQHQRFGKKSEVNIGEPIVEPENVQLQTVSGYTRRKSKKPHTPLDLSSLPRHQFYHDLAEEHKFCKACTNPLSKIGQDFSEQIEVLPQRLYVAEHIRYKYACRHCETLQMAPKPKAPIPKALAGGSLLAEIIVNKYQYHLPLYRQSKILANYAVNIPDNTLGQWVIQSGTGLMPVYEAFWDAVLETFYLQVDETPVKILKPEKKGYLWTYFAPYVGKGLVVFELSLTRGGEVAQKRLANFEGQLQTDGYAGYQNLRKREGIRGFGCMSHARRKFDEVLKITKNVDGIAAEVIKRLKPVYALEEKMREMKVSFHTRKRLRQKRAWPLLKSLHSWLKQNASKVPAKSKLSTAIQYMLNQWCYLIAYLRHGCVEIDTNWVENKIRQPALGRRNWLFMGHEGSGLVHALWYSLVISAVINGLNPRVYIYYLLSKTHDIRTKAIDPITLLPHTIDLVQLKIFADQQIALAKEVLDSS
jgi:transposase